MGKVKGKRFGLGISRNKKQVGGDYDNVSQANIINKRTEFIISEAYRTTRTNIMFSLVDEEKCKKIVITSAIPGDGKTISSINLAITFAQTGSKVLIVDCDLRRPKVGTYLGVNGGKGLSDVLGNLCILEDVTLSHEGIDYIPAGQIPQNPAELLSSKRMENVIDELSEQYDYIFFDTPPISLVTDASGFLDKVSGVIMVVRQNHTTHKAVQAALSAFEFTNAKVLGFILNDSGFKHHSYRGKRYGSYYSGYYG